MPKAFLVLLLSLVLPGVLWSSFVIAGPSGITLWRRGLLAGPTRIALSSIRRVRVRSPRPGLRDSCRRSFLQIQLQSGSSELLGPWNVATTHARVNRTLASLVAHLDAELRGRPPEMSAAS